MLRSFRNVKDPQRDWRIGVIGLSLLSKRYRLVGKRRLPLLQKLTNGCLSTPLHPSRPPRRPAPLQHPISSLHFGIARYDQFELVVLPLSPGSHDRFASTCAENKTSTPRGRGRFSDRGIDEGKMKSGRAEVDKVSAA